MIAIKMILKCLVSHFTTVPGGVGVVKTRYNANLSSTATAVAVGIATGTELGNIIQHYTPLNNT